MQGKVNTNKYTEHFVLNGLLISQILIKMYQKDRLRIKRIINKKETINTDYIKLSSSHLKIILCIWNSGNVCLIKSLVISDRY